MNIEIIQNNKVVALTATKQTVQSIINYATNGPINQQFGIQNIQPGDVIKINNVSTVVTQAMINQALQQGV